MRKKQIAEQLPPRIKSANGFVNVKDIKGSFLYSKDKYLFGYIRIYAYNLDLLSRADREVKAQALSTALGAERRNFDYMSFPREVDLDEYKNHLKKTYTEELNNIGKRKILATMMKKAQEISTSGENYEHQHFIKLWEPINGHEPEAKHELYVRMETFRDHFRAVGIQAEILLETDIIKLCNLFGNSQQVAHEKVDPNLRYSGISQIR